MQTYIQQGDHPVTMSSGAIQRDHHPSRPRQTREPRTVRSDRDPSRGHVVHCRADRLRKDRVHQRYRGICPGRHRDRADGARERRDPGRGVHPGPLEKAHRAHHPEYQVPCRHVGRGIPCHACPGTEDEQAFALLPTRSTSPTSSRASRSIRAAGSRHSPGARPVP